MFYALQNLNAVVHQIDILNYLHLFAWLYTKGIG